MKKLKDIRKKRWFVVATNKYVLITLVFIIWMLFFDTNSLLIHHELKKQIHTLEEQNEYLREEIKKDKKIIKQLSNPKELEKFARENYYLKKTNEDIFLIEYADSIKLKKND